MFKTRKKVLDNLMNKLTRVGFKSDKDKNASVLSKDPKWVGIRNKIKSQNI